MKKLGRFIFDAVRQVAAFLKQFEFFQQRCDVGNHVNAPDSPVIACNVFVVNTADIADATNRRRLESREESAYGF